MRIYAVADIHGKEKNITGLSRVIAEHKPDLLVIAGDIFNYRIPASAIQHLENINIPILGIRGNSDLSWNHRKLTIRTPVTLLSGRAHHINGFSFLGLNGTLLLPLVSKIGFFESQILAPL